MKKVILEVDENRVILEVEEKSDSRSWWESSNSWLKSVILALIGGKSSSIRGMLGYMDFRPICLMAYFGPFLSTVPPTKIPQPRIVNSWSYAFWSLASLKTSFLLIQESGSSKKKFIRSIKNFKKCKSAESSLLQNDSPSLHNYLSASLNGPINI